MEKEDKIKKQLFEEIEELRIKLKEAEDTLSAIRGGEVDAIVVSGLQGQQVFTLTGAEQAYRVLIETMNEGAASLNQEGIIIYCNQRFSEMIKIPLEKVVGTPMRQFIRTSDLPVFDSLMERGPQENGKGEVAFINNDGTVLPVLLSISALQKDNANIYGITVTDLTAQKHIEDELKRHRDNLEELVKDRTNELEISNQQLREEITERKRVEETLRASQQLIEGIINAIPVRVFWKDKNLVYLGCNAAFARDAGYADPKDIIGKDDYQMGWRDQAESYRSDDRQVVESGSSKLLREEPRTTPEGNTITLLTSKIPLLSSKGGIIGVLGTYMDITELKRTEEALIFSEKKFRNLLETINLVAVMLDCNGTITFCNNYFLHLTGWTRDEVLDKNWFDLFLPDDIREPALAMFTSNLAKGIIPAHYDNLILARDGTRKHIEWNNSLLLDTKVKVIGVASIGVDVTEQKKLEDQLRHAQKMEAVGTLAGGIAHDFNNILNVIIGYGTMVMDTLEAGSSSKEQMNEVLIAAERAATLTKRLLVFSRKQVVEVQPININELIHGLQKMLVRIISESIAFDLDLAERSLMVLADAGQIEQVLMNLATNSKDAMPEGGRLTIGTGLQELDDEYVAAYGYGKPGIYALITVADTGQGMDAETQKKIFEPFFTTKGIGEGTGLGLAISYGIIKQHSGYIKVYSEPGQGTLFKIYLPLIEESISLGKKTEAPVAVKGGNETILVAEDDASLRKLSRIVLESYGYRVIMAEDGEDAITKFMENRDKIALVILDMIMPKKNGKEVCAVISKVSPGIKILFASGYTMDIIKTTELTEAGFDFILKPVLPRDLVRKVREVLDK